MEDSHVLRREFEGKGQRNKGRLKMSRKKQVEHKKKVLRLV